MHLAAQALWAQNGNSNAPLRIDSNLPRESCDQNTRSSDAAGDFPLKSATAAAAQRHTRRRWHRHRKSGQQRCHFNPLRREVHPKTSPAIHSTRSWNSKSINVIEASAAASDGALLLGEDFSGSGNASLGGKTADLFDAVLIYAGDSATWHAGSAFRADGSITADTPLKWKSWRAAQNGKINALKLMDCRDAFALGSPIAFVWPCTIECSECASNESCLATSSQ